MLAKAVKLTARWAVSRKILGDLTVEMGVRSLTSLFVILGVPSYGNGRLQGSIAEGREAPVIFLFCSGFIHFR